ncbi:hypothetical protein WJX73_009978 [Symbiochloris irregularis]|uniref:Uncharacterized protein n=1 Tax=Symbiochloris irregularis TaxID=706552 RepID=A0AAW1PAU8_9CHLO
MSSASKQEVSHSVTASEEPQDEPEVRARLEPLLRGEHVEIAQEDLAAQLEVLITGVFKTADNHWQFSVEGYKSRLPGITAAAEALKALVRRPQQATGVGRTVKVCPRSALTPWMDRGSTHEIFGSITAQ